MIKTLYRISYFNTSDGVRHYYMRTGFESIEEAEEEWERIKKENVSIERQFGRGKWINRTEWAVSKLENKINTLVKYL